MEKDTGSFFQIFLQFNHCIWLLSSHIPVYLLENFLTVLIYLFLQMHYFIVFWFKYDVYLKRWGYRIPYVYLYGGI